MNPETVTNQEAAPELPTENPDYVRVTCPIACDLHGWTLNESYPTVPLYKELDGYRDANGFNIYVQSVKWNRPVYLSSIEYSLVLNETIKQ